MFSYFITRGVELLDAEDNTVNSIPNTVCLHKLIHPTSPGGSFQIEEVKRFKHDDYSSNSWLIKITSNGRYILAPTFHGQVFVFNIASGEVTAVFKDHQEIEVRDVLFHPTKKLVFTCADDGSVRVYRSEKDYLSN
jgi:WD40 repeat protein